MRHRKHWSDRLRDRIAELERVGEVVSKAAKKAEESARLHYDQLMDLRRCHDETVTRLGECEKERLQLTLENQRLRGELLAQDKLIDSLEKTTAEVKKLKKQLNQRCGKEEPYGLSTPSSKRVYKGNSTEENRAKRGGAPHGHKGWGRRTFMPWEIDQEVHIPVEEPMDCDCGSRRWKQKESVCRSVVRFVPAQIKKQVYHTPVHQCMDCGKVLTSRITGVTPRALYDNCMVAHMLAEFYFHGATAGSVERRYGVNIGTFLGMAHRVAAAIRPVFDRILGDVRNCKVLHADETTWSNDGQTGYAWFFGNDDIRIFIFRKTRGSVVPKDILGEEPLPMVLVTDRYSGYSPLSVNRQFCFAHLLRDLKKEENNFPGDAEVLTFAAAFKPLLKEAIALRKKGLTMDEYRTRAEQLKDQIMENCWQEANHPSVQHIQNIFRENEDKLFQWTSSPDIPAENNFAERELRPTVIARKISFGSQSEKGLETREMMMTVMNTAKCRGWEPATLINKILDALATNKDADIAGILDEDCRSTLVA